MNLALVLVGERRTLAHRLSAATHRLFGNFCFMGASLFQDWIPPQPCHTTSVQPCNYLDIPVQLLQSFTGRWGNLKNFFNKVLFWPALPYPPVHPTVVAPYEKLCSNTSVLICRIPCYSIPVPLHCSVHAPLSWPSTSLLHQHWAHLYQRLLVMLLLVGGFTPGMNLIQYC